MFRRFVVIGRLGGIQGGSRIRHCGMMIHAACVSQLVMIRLILFSNRHHAVLKVVGH